MAYVKQEVVLMNDFWDDVGFTGHKAAMKLLCACLFEEPIPVVAHGAGSKQAGTMFFRVSEPSKNRVLASRCKCTIATILGQVSTSPLQCPRHMPFCAARAYGTLTVSRSIVEKERKVLAYITSRLGFPSLKF